MPLSRKPKITNGGETKKQVKNGMAAKVLLMEHCSAAYTNGKASRELREPNGKCGPAASRDQRQRQRNGAIHVLLQTIPFFGGF